MLTSFHSLRSPSAASWWVAAGLALVPGLLQLAPVEAAARVFTGTGRIVDAVNDFTTALGGPSHGGTPSEQTQGRREINWDAVAQEKTNRNDFPANFFNDESKRGLIMSSGTGQFRVSDRNFEDVNNRYQGQFQFFSSARTFAPIATNTLELTFQSAGSRTPALTSGFGCVFSDVDRAGSARIEFFRGAQSLGVFQAPRRSDSDGLSFLGVVFDAGEGITRVKITCGEAPIGPGVHDISQGGVADLVVMDDFFYGEPHADSDLDGVRDTLDECLYSDTRARVDVNGDGEGQTSIENLVDASGCTIQDLVLRCRRETQGRGAYIRCIQALSRTLAEDGIITTAQAKEMRAAAQTTPTGS